MENQWGTFIQSYDSRPKGEAALKNFKAAFEAEGVRAAKFRLHKIETPFSDRNHVYKKIIWDIYLRGT